jgi:hypothetical protein
MRSVLAREERRAGAGRRLSALYLAHDYRLPRSVTISPIGTALLPTRAAVPAPPTGGRTSFPADGRLTARCGGGAEHEGRRCAGERERGVCGGGKDEINGRECVHVSRWYLGRSYGSLRVRLFWEKIQTLEVHILWDRGSKLV